MRASQSFAAMLRRAASLKRGFATTTRPTLSSQSADIVKEEEVEHQVENIAAAPVTKRPPHYRKVHRHHTAKHLLQDEFPNAGDLSGSGARLYDYYKTAEMVNSLPTVKEKIDFVSPYERPWTRAEQTWRRDWHPSLMATRKAWSVPSSPAYFDSLRYYQYITKTRLSTDSLDSFYKGLVPPTATYERLLSESLSQQLSSTRFDSEEERTSAVLAAVLDDAVASLAHNVPRLADMRTAYDVQSEAFWIRSGFMFLYDEREIGSDKVERKLHNTQKYTGDDRRKLGELAFVARNKCAAQLRARSALSPLHSLTESASRREVFPEGTQLADDVLFAPRVYNMWPDEEPLWQCPGFFAESGETHTGVRLSLLSTLPLTTRADQLWQVRDAERKQTLAEGMQAAAVQALFATNCASAHAQGFTQYTDVTSPLASQMIVSDGQLFSFAIGQLNTLAINIECDGFVNERSNVAYVEGPVSLYSEFRDGVFYHEGAEGERKEGLNPAVLSRVLQMLMRE